MSNRRQYPTSSSPPLPLLPAPMDDEDLLSEILLRLPPHPSSLPRASLVCTHWRDIVSDPRFLCRFRAHHRRPPLLGFFLRMSRELTFVPTLDPPDRIPAARFFLPPRFKVDVFMGCRHGRALFLNRIQSEDEVVVWDPVTGDQRAVAVPPDFHVRGSKVIFNGAVLCVAGEDGHVHGSCHSSPFQVALVAFDTKIARVYARVYSSQTGVWGSIIQLELQMDYKTPGFSPSTLVQGSLYWTILHHVGAGGTGILELDLIKQSLALIELPPGLSRRISRFLTMPGEDGGLGLISVSGVHAQLWERKVEFSGAAVWVLERRIDLGKLLSLISPARGFYHIPLVFDEDNSAIFVRTDVGVFMVHLGSMRFKDVSSSMGELGRGGYYPFTSFYAAGIQFFLTIA